MKKFLLSCIFGGCMAAISAQSTNFPIQTASGRSAESVVELGDWLFGGKALPAKRAISDKRTNWGKVTLPHTWNTTDGEDGNASYMRNVFWYHTDFSVAKNQSGKKVYIEFFGANTRTTLYVNGQKVGNPHRGGYTAFRYNITDFLKSGENAFDVSVDNRPSQDTAPISGDFNMCGGLYRRVFLVFVDDVHIDLENYGSSGLFLETPNMRSKTLPADLGVVKVKTKIVNEGKSDKKVTVKILVDGKNAPQIPQDEVVVKSGAKLDYEKMITVKNPALWGENGFYLNGKKHPLRGVNRHQFLKEKGNAMTESEHAADMEIITELGANVVRLCHYPHTDFFYDLCDENGNGASLTDPLSSDAVRNAKALLKNLDELAHSLDTTGRFTTQAVNRDYAMNKNDSESVNLPSKNATIKVVGKSNGVEVTDEASF